MVIKSIPCFKLSQIADSGQCFRWKKLADERYRIIAFGKKLDVWEENEKFYFDCTKEDFDAIWYEYFDLGTDYEAVLRAIDAEDRFMINAAGASNGIRILKQELWEMIISYIISQNNNIPRIKNSIEKLSEKFGEVLGEEDYAFPDYEGMKKLILCEEDVSLLTDMGLGYRDKYICELILNSKDYASLIGDIRSYDYETAMNYLLTIKGIGKKVANCICLFGLYKIEACPVDTWIRRIIEEEYDGVAPGWTKSKYAGIYQQYAFYYKRLMSGK
ncbi:MAG: 8-oxoguanine DNA glycosylase [Lachnospiraceae bacterium]|nr:8-oxoguanine DNA glycosylase [Lachnospiraceae bacterium]